MSRAACLALSTSGWSNGLIPMQPSGHHGGVLPQQHLRAQRRGGPRRAQPEAGRSSSWSPGPRVTSTSSPVLGAKFGAARDGTTTGRMPLPSLPVDSAMSCSAQSPNPAMPEPLSASTTLSTPAALATPRSAPSRSPGLSGVVGLQGGLDRVRLVEQPPRRQRRRDRSAPARRRSAPSSGHPPRGRRGRRGSRRPAPTRRAESRGR